MITLSRAVASSAATRDCVPACNYSWVWETRAREAGRWCELPLLTETLGPRGAGDRVIRQLRHFGAVIMHQTLKSAYPEHNFD